LLSALRAKFHGQSSSREALEISVEAPDDLAAREDIAALLREHISHDTEFAAWLANLWEEIRPAFGSDAGQSVNVISGTVHGHAIQGRDIKGGIHLG
jgi:hypothetical protein